MEVEVTGAVITAIKLDSTSASVAKGQIKQLSAIAIYGDGTEINVTDSVAWRPAAPTIATVTPWATIPSVGYFLVTAKTDRYQNANFLDWGSAKSYCETLSIGNSSWRLPTKDELIDLYNTYLQNQLHDLFGWPTQDEPYWSSTQKKFNVYYNAFLSNGLVFSSPYSYRKYVACVRLATTY